MSFKAFPIYIPMEQDLLVESLESPSPRYSYPSKTLQTFAQGCKPGILFCVCPAISQSSFAVTCHGLSDANIRLRRTRSKAPLSPFCSSETFRPGNLAKHNGLVGMSIQKNNILFPDIEELYSNQVFAFQQFRELKLHFPLESRSHPTYSKGVNRMSSIAKSNISTDDIYIYSNINITEWMEGQVPLKPIFSANLCPKLQAWPIVSHAPRFTSIYQLRSSARS